MRRSELEKSWAITRQHLNAAFDVLAGTTLPGTAEARFAIREYEEFLDHIELELAMDMLEAAVEGQAAPNDFWQQLIHAARNMGLEERADQFAERLR